MRCGGIKVLAAACALVLSASAAQAQQATVTVSIKDQKFQPAAVRGMAGAPTTLRLMNLDATPVEVASATLHFDRLLSPNTGVTVQVPAMPPGRYVFFNVAHQQAQGTLEVR
jgi:uncharacterized protein (DUF2141 family)